jgi:hypothetical protein
LSGLSIAGWRFAIDREMLAVNARQLMGCCVRVYLGRRNTLMAQHLLERDQIGTGVEHVRGERVPEAVRGDVSAGGDGKRSLHDPRDRPAGDALSGTVDKNRSSAGNGFGG